MRRLIASALAIVLIGPALAHAQTYIGADGQLHLAPLAQSQQRSSAPQAAPAPTHADILRGEYGRYRANNDLLFYHLDIRVDPEQKFVSGRNRIRFKMLKDDKQIQLDLYDNLNVDKIQYTVSGARGRVSSSKVKELKYERDSGAVFVDFPETLKAGRVYSIDFYYSGTPQTIGRFGGFTFGTDRMSRPWIFTACEGEGASIWWPNKDQWRDEVESMQISVAIPNNLTDVSNGKFMKDHWQLIQTTTEWKTMKTALKKDEFAVATDLYFVDVSKL